MSINPNTVKSQDDLNPCNDGKRSSDVLVEAISKLETTTKELEKVKKERDRYYNALKVSVLKEQWESTLRDSMEKSGKIETLQKQLEIAVEGLNEYAKPHNVDMYDGGYTISIGGRYLSDKGKLARKYLQRIQELNK